jgi:endonuclease YncB( thermonuclease family)
MEVICQQMPFTLIKGTFHVVGYSPDGDSIRFQANNPEHWSKVKGSPPQLNENDHVQIRLIGIDSLETHFRDCQQSMKWAISAANFLLKSLEISQVQWNEEQNIVVKAEDKVAGFILVKKTDQHGRPLAFIFSGKIDEQDGSDFFLPLDLFFRSVNYQSLLHGESYPTYYRGIAPTLRSKMTSAVNYARQNNRGLWKFDSTNKGFYVKDLFAEDKSIVILPKLFRRLVSHLENNQNWATFKNSVVKSEKVLILPHKEKKLFRDIIIQQEDFFKLAELPEDLVYL